jgi:hypothetical protein
MAEIGPFPDCPVVAKIVDKLFPVSTNGTDLMLPFKELDVGRVYRLFKGHSKTGQGRALQGL